MIEDDWDFGVSELLLNRPYHGEAHIHLDVPRAAANLPKCLLQTLARICGIVLPRCSEINADAANPAAMHAVKLGGRSLLVDDGNAARFRTQLLDRIERAGVVGSIYTGLDYHCAVEM